MPKRTEPSNRDKNVPYDDPFGGDAIRDALKALNDPQRLQRHPLASLDLVTSRCQDGGSASERGAILRDVLREAIASLKPEGEQPDQLSDAWRSYLILSQQYVDGRSPDYLADTMNMGRTTYYRKQLQALHLLGSALRQTARRLAGKGMADSAQRPPFMAPPRPVYGLVGRERLLGEIKRRLLAGENMALSALHGLPGIGKTALAVALANDTDVLTHFEDGVLWAGLGRSPDVLALLSVWGVALGIAADDLAQRGGVEERARAVHAAIGTRRMLLVVDDAWDAEMALAFRVGGPNCAHILTTRIPQVALAFADGGVAAVDELDEADGLALLERMAPGAVEAVPDEVQALVNTVGGLPLALMLMGWHLRKESYGRHPRRLRDALEQLGETAARQQITQPQTALERRPDVPAGTPLSLQAIIGISDEALDEEGQRALRALSVLPAKPNTFSEKAALAVAAVPVQVLDVLADHGLLEPSGEGRYTIHQTIADYASLELAEDTGAQRAANERMATFFVDYAASHQETYGLLASESDNITAALEAAFEAEMEAELVRGANAIYPLLAARGLHGLAERHLDRASQVIRDVGDVSGMALTLHNLGQARQWLGDYAQAEAHYQQALDLARESRDAKRAAAIMRGLGIVASCRGDLDQAADYCRQGLSLARESGDRQGEGDLLSSLGDLLLTAGQAEQAKGYFEQALTIAREAGSRESEGVTLIYLGLCSHSVGQIAQAIERYQQALGIARETGDRRIESYALGYLGLAQITLGQLGETVAGGSDPTTSAGDCFLEAIATYERALAIAREIGHPKGEADCLVHLGVAHCALGETEQAIAYTQSALAIARELGTPSEEMGALCGLGDVYRSLEQPDQAIEYYQQALATARKIGANRQAADALSGLAQAHATLGQVASAIDSAEQALEILEAINHPQAPQMKALLAQLRTQAAG